MKGYKRGSHFYFQPMRGLTILVKAINKIQLFPAQLTSIHADLCRVRATDKTIIYIKIPARFSLYSFIHINMSVLKCCTCYDTLQATFETLV